jgi:hypothetical protein
MHIPQKDLFYSPDAELDGAGMEDSKRRVSRF